MNWPVHFVNYKHSDFITYDVNLRSSHFPRVPVTYLGYSLTQQIMWRLYLCPHASVWMAACICCSTVLQPVPGPVLNASARGLNVQMVHCNSLCLLDATLSSRAAWGHRFQLKPPFPHHTPFFASGNWNPPLFYPPVPTLSVCAQLSKGWQSRAAPIADIK